MDLPETRQQKNLRFDFYEALLTAKQREVFTMHYMEDNSLAEIGAYMEITPQAVADMLKRVNGRLNHYDKLLGLVEKSENQQAFASKINLALDDLESNPHTTERGAIIAQIRRLLNSLTSNL
ncbi:MAG: hypothetical protein FWB96_04395 [Defluviitaleaceae bacterium]|nr:hypothetical protein [Defluviitaleaceae bacterium]MCL2262936.1 hypothetical protein [Defluviitaleaceae bacterium]